MEIYHVSRSRCRQFTHDMDLFTGRIKSAALQITAREEAALKISESRVRLTDPQLLLQRGYSYTLYNGKALTSDTQVKGGDLITTVLKNGRLKSIVSDGK